MSIEYQIVWVDDAPAWVESVRGQIEEHIRELGFQPNIKQFESGDGFQRYCTSVDLDLVVVDYNLPDEKGDELIAQLRENGIFKEVVFYSLQQIPQDVKGKCDGVFYSIRDDAVEMIKKAIDITVHKLQDLEVVRGLVIASTIDMEVKLEELMVLIFRDLGNLFQEKVIEKRIYDFENKIKFVQSYMKDVVSEATLENKERLKALSDKLKTFAPDVIDQRNILAHARKTTFEDRTILQGINNRTKEIVFDEQWLSDTRRKLREHMENLLKIEAVLRK